MTYLRDFMIENRIHHTFWCFNENSGDTGGLVYDNFGNGTKKICSGKTVAVAE